MKAVLECDKACFPLFYQCLVALTLYQLGKQAFLLSTYYGTAVAYKRVFYFASRSKALRLTFYAPNLRFAII